MLDVRRLRVLRAVAREGSISAAARALDYTQPAVSHHVARLEAEVGLALVVRAARGVRLTEAGERLVAHADAVLARLADAEEELAGLAGLRAGRVRLSAFPSGSATLVPPAIAALRRAHPGVRVDFAEEEPPEALARLRAGDADVALVFRYPEDAAGPGPGLVAEPLLGDALLAVLPAGHRLQRRRRIALADLAGEPWIAGCVRCRRHLLHACAEAGFAPDVTHATDDVVTVQALVAAGLGVALVPRLALASIRRDDVAIRPLAEPAERAIDVVAAAAPRPPAVAAMVAALHAAAAGRGAG
jgi:molybdate transport repressor ModE-like protein